MITYQVEAFKDLIDELIYLNQLHWEEVEDYKDTIPLDIDYDKYTALDCMGVLHIMTARSDDKLIGYYISFIQPNLHHKTCTFAISDVIFIHPLYRKGLVGYKLIKHVEGSLKKLGVDVMQIISKTSNPLESIVNRLGFSNTETVHSKFIGDK